jgi:hypothetical protein
MSKQIDPSLYTFGWNILVTNFTTGALFGYSSLNAIVNLNVPPSHGVPSGPKITACHAMMFDSLGVPLIPAGGSVCKRLKSRIRRFLAGVLIAFAESNQKEFANANQIVRRVSVSRAAVDARKSTRTSFAHRARRSLDVRAYARARRTVETIETAARSAEVRWGFVSSRRLAPLANA